MDGISASTMSYTDVIVDHARQTQGRALINLMDVVNQAVITQSTPLASIGGVGMSLDLYA